MSIKKEKAYLAFIRISAGSSWYQTDQKEDFELMAFKAVKQAKRDWKHLFKFKKAGEQRLCVHVYDISKAEGWSADWSGNVTCLETKQECPYLEKIYVVV